MHKIYYSQQIIPHLNGLYGRRNIADVERYERVLGEFKRRFGYDYAYMCSSSGRVEIVGNHLDHNGGTVIGCAINLDIIAAFRGNNTNTVTICGRDRNPIRLDLSDTAAKHTHSAGLVAGVLAYLKMHGYAIGGFDAYTDSTVPSGAGVSSSAAFELVVGSIANHLFNGGAISPEILAKAGQFAENEYFNKPCGLLDQSVVAVGGLVKLDFASELRFEQLQAQNSAFRLVLVDTGGSHSALSHLYAEIPAEMYAVARHFGKKRLIEVDENAFFDQFDDILRTVGRRPALRAKHFFEENRRVAAAEVALARGDTEMFVDLINKSGDSSLYQLQNCAVDEKDTAIADAIALARGICPCGARVHGGGFAGTVLCVVPTEHLQQFVDTMQAHYGVSKVLPLLVRPYGATVL